MKAVKLADSCKNYSTNGYYYGIDAFYFLPNLPLTHSYHR